MKNQKWQWKTVEELFHFGAGKTVSPATRPTDKAIPFLRTSNVYWDRIDLSSLDYMSLPEDTIEEKRLLPGDLLVCEGGDIGRSAIWNGEVELITFQNHLHRLRAKNDQVVPQFYVYFFQSAFTQLGLFEGAGNKTTIPNLSKGRLGALEVPFPPKEEQERIANQLKMTRSLIALRNKEVSLLEELFQTKLFSHMSGKSSMETGL